MDEFVGYMRKSTDALTVEELKECFNKIDAGTVH